MSSSSPSCAPGTETSSNFGKPPKLPRRVQQLFQHPRIRGFFQHPWISPHIPKELLEPPPPPTDVDLVISGGGLKGYFILGARHAIADRGDLRVCRYSGTSAGAWTAMFMACGLSNADWLATYTLTAAVARRAAERGEAAPALMEAYRDSVWPWLSTVLPSDAYKRCSGKLFITITKVENLKPRPHVISHFGSNEELFEACVASSRYVLCNGREAP